MNILPRTLATRSASAHVASSAPYTRRQRNRQDQHSRRLTRHGVSYSGPLYDYTRPFLPPNARYEMTEETTMQYAAHVLLNGFLPQFTNSPNQRTHHLLQAISGIHDLIWCMQRELEDQQQSRQRFNSRLFRQYLTDLNHVLIICLSNQFTVDEFRRQLSRYYENMRRSQQAAMVTPETSPSSSSDDLPDLEDISTLGSVISEEPEEANPVTTSMATPHTDTTFTQSESRDISPLILPFPMEPPTQQEILQAQIFQPMPMEDIGANPMPNLLAPAPLSAADLEFLASLPTDEQLRQWLSSAPS